MALGNIQGGWDACKQVIAGIYGDRMEWIIVDDGADKIDDLVNSSSIDQIKYYKVDKKMYLSEKRNYVHKFAKGTMIMYMDDDDYYPPERVSHTVDKLQENKEANKALISKIG